MKLSRLVVESYRRAKRLALLRESTAPLLGPYYWILTPTGWDILSYPEDEYGEMVHDRVWRRYVVPFLQDIWQLTAAEVLILNKVPYGLPRGRISKGVGRVSANVYYLNHGDDAPVPDPLSIILREMNLTGLYTTGKLKVILDEHERQLAQHKQAVEFILATAHMRLNDKSE